MCGFAGILGRSANAETIRKMSSVILHRGPDDSGIWFDPSARLALAHRRLSIVDTSSAGKQPMHSHCRRYVIVFNGEIYNHQALRKALESSCQFLSNWSGHSDTETLLACITNWGIEKTLKETIGMFAFALWDSQSRNITLARDRMGEKPLYYGVVNGSLVFASELKSIKALPGFSAEIDRESLALQLRYSYIPDPNSIFRDIKKLTPGSWLTLSANQLPFDNNLNEPVRYWSALDIARSGTQQQLHFSSDSEAIDALDKHLRQAVGLQMTADVPLGEFLSGGIDSSAVVSLMQAQRTRPVKTFSIGFHESSFNEAPFAKAIAKHLKTEHTELYVSAADALAIIPKLPLIYDEPFSDPSQIPTYLLAQMCRSKVKVSLSGDGGDELFGGYSRYILAEKIWRNIELIPMLFRKIIASTILSASPSKWDYLFRLLKVIPGFDSLNLTGDKIHKGAGVIASNSEINLYRSLVSHWDGPANLLYGASAPDSLLTNPWPDLPSLTEQMMAFDTTSYLPGDILTKLDRAAMAVSLETRVPLLDHRLVEFAWKLPMKYKVRNGQGKWLLRQMLYNYIPRSLVDRPKMGFGVPIDSWLRGPLKDWAEDLLDESRLKRQGYLNPAPIRKKWSEHLSGRRNWQYHLWDVLMFQAWHEKNS